MNLHPTDFLKKILAKASVDDNDTLLTTIALSSLGLKDMQGSEFFKEAYKNANSVGEKKLALKGMFYRALHLKDRRLDFDEEIIFLRETTDRELKYFVTDLLDRFLND